MPVKLKSLPPFDLVSSLLSYDVETGNLIWKVSSHRKAAGSIAGSTATGGYVHVTIKKQTYKAHRLIWLLCKIEHPPMFIDHIDGNTSNNRIGNLRLADVNENKHNQKTSRNNTSGLKGVCWSKDSSKWQAQIKYLGKSIYLGMFNTPEQAHAAYAEAACKYFGEFARTS